MRTDNPYITTITKENSFPFAPNYVIKFYKEGNDMGKLDLNGDKLKFEGDVEESAKVFIDFLLSTFNQRIEEIKKEAFDAGVKSEYLSYKDSFIDNPTN